MIFIFINIFIYKNNLLFILFFFKLNNIYTFFSLKKTLKINKINFFLIILYILINNFINNFIVQ